LKQDLNKTGEVVATSPMTENGGQFSNSFCDQV
jgi:hypothetical protein